MALPKIKYPLFELTVPSTGDKIQYRPFTVREEKFLLIAQESDSLVDRLRAIRQVINNCATNLPCAVEDLPSFDLEYMFLQMRSKSVGNIVELSYRDNTDKKIYNFSVDIDKIELTTSPDHSKTIMFKEDLGIVMNYPSIEALENLKAYSESTEAILSLLKSCIASIWTEDNQYDAADFDKTELDEFVQSLTTKEFQKIRYFFESMPRLEHTLHYTDAEGTAKTIQLLGIDDFF